jgi:hypothetical protein
MPILTYVLPFVIDWKCFFVVDDDSTTSNTCNFFFAGALTRPLSAVRIRFVSRLKPTFIIETDLEVIQMVTINTQYQTQ